MAFSLVKHMSRPGCAVVRRYLAPTAARMSSVGPPIDKSGVLPKDRPAQIMSPDRDNVYPKIGNREIVGFGKTAFPDYEDSFQWPHSAVRWQEYTAELLGIREKEQGDWSALSIEDKKKLYRASYCQTFSEFTAPTGEWKHIFALFFAGLAAAGLFMVYLNKFVYLPVRTNSAEWQAETIRQQVLRRDQPIAGVASNFDYENNKWK